jgi:glucose/arabinose dehydrogenase
MSSTFSLAGPYVVDETSQWARVRIERTTDLKERASVDYATADITAIAGADYVDAEGTATFQRNQTEVTVKIRLLDDGVAEGEERFAFDLTGSTDGTVGFPRTATIVVADNEAPGGGEPPPPTPPPSTGFEVTTEILASGLDSPIAFDWLPSGGGALVAAEKSGLIKVVQPGGATYDLLDLRSIVNDVGDRGLLDIALHPDFAANPYLYAYASIDPSDTANHAEGTLQGPDGAGNRYVQLHRYTVTTGPDGRLAVDPASKVVLLGGAGDSLDDISGGGAVDSTTDFDQPPSGIVDGTNVHDYIAGDSSTHVAGALEFGPDGLLYVTVGDGTSFNFADWRTARVQDLDNLSGKVLRIDPLTGDGVAANPFFTGDADANASKVYALGLRNGFRATFDGDTLVVGDVGWNSWEEVNLAAAGANLGWPWYEGGPDGSLQTPEYRDFAEAQAFYASGATATAPFLAFSHYEPDPGVWMQAIVLGDVYDGATYPEALRNDLFFASLTTGEVFTVDMDDPSRTVQELTQHAGAIVFMDEGPDGLMYFADIANGTIGRWQVTGTAEAPEPTVTADLALSAPDYDLRLASNPNFRRSEDLDGATLDGRNDFVFLAGDTANVRRVEFAVDGRVVRTDWDAPWTAGGGFGSGRGQDDLDIAGLTEGEHLLSARVVFTDDSTLTVADRVFVDSPLL